MASQIYVRLNGEQLRVLAHPLRNRILSALRSDGPSTATGVAERLASNSGKTSYHLRVLGDVGLVIEETERGNARERWWRAAHDGTNLEPLDFADDPEAMTALDYLMGRYARFAAAQVEQWLTSREEWSPDWVEAAALSDQSMRLTPVQLTAMNQEVSAVIGRYVEATIDADDPDAVNCTTIYNAFPNPHPLL
jgi:DNA-binding transcriptional ArsR family regulator